MLNVFLSLGPNPTIHARSSESTSERNPTSDLVESLEQGQRLRNVLIALLALTVGLILCAAAFLAIRMEMMRRNGSCRPKGSSKCDCALKGGYSALDTLEKGHSHPSKPESIASSSPPEYSFVSKTARIHSMEDAPPGSRSHSGFWSLLCHRQSEAVLGNSGFRTSRAESVTETASSSSEMSFEYAEEILTIVKPSAVHKSPTTCSTQPTSPNTAGFTGFPATRAFQFRCLQSGGQKQARQLHRTGAVMSLTVLSLNRHQLI